MTTSVLEGCWCEDTYFVWLQKDRKIYKISHKYPHIPYTLKSCKRNVFCSKLFIHRLYIFFRLSLINPLTEEEHTENILMTESGNNGL